MTLYSSLLSASLVRSDSISPFTLHYNDTLFLLIVYVNFINPSIIKFPQRKKPLLERTVSTVPLQIPVDKLEPARDAFYCEQSESPHNSTDR